MSVFSVRVSQKRYGTIIVTADSVEHARCMFEDGDIDEGNIDPEYDDGSEEICFESATLIRE